MQARRIDVPEDAYHADPCPEPSLSASLAKVMLSKSPLHGWHNHPRLGAGARVDKDAYDRGHLLHKLVLGKGRDVEIVDADSWQTKAAREARIAAREANRIPALRGAYDNAVLAAETIKRRLDAMKIHLTGESEVQITWQELSNHGPIWCRSAIDHLVIEGDTATIYDLKSCASAHPRAMTKAVINYGYDVQAAAYTSAVRKLYPHLRHVDFVFLFAEHAAPFAVTPGVLDDAIRMHGEEGWTRSIIEFGELRHEPGEWPGYASDIITIEAPGWLVGGGSPEIGFEEEET